MNHEDGATCAGGDCSSIPALRLTPGSSVALVLVLVLSRVRETRLHALGGSCFCLVALLVPWGPFFISACAALPACHARTFIFSFLTFDHCLFGKYLLPRWFLRVCACRAVPCAREASMSLQGELDTLRSAISSLHGQFSKGSKTSTSCKLVLLLTLLLHLDIRECLSIFSRIAAGFFTPCRCWYRSAHGSGSPRLIYSACLTCPKWRLVRCADDHSDTPSTFRRSLYRPYQSSNLSLPLLREALFLGVGPATSFRPSTDTKSAATANV